MLKKAMKQTETLPRELRLKDLDSLLKEKNQTIDQWVEWAYANTKLKDVAFAKSLFNKKVKELEALDEPFIQMAKRLYPEVEAYRKRGKQNQAALEELRKRYIDALYAWKGSGLYPDANGTLRFSYGQVQGYSPRDAVYYKPFTTLKGMMAKDTGKRPFDVPEGLKPLYAKKDFGRWLHPDLEQVPIAFTHKVDSTGGNSGSPVMNAKGELVGILFDGNYEAMTADWQYEEAITRSISVDIRMVMFVTEKLAHAYHILEEMNIR
jgi:hypothetical protein